MVNPRVCLLTLAALAFGSGAYVFSGLLDPMARDIGSSVAAAGQLQTAFVMAAAIGGPLLAMWSGRMDRKRLLIVALAAITLLTAWCAFASNFGLLLLLRVLAGATGGVVMPAAAAAAASLVPAHQRGSAIAMVLGGMTLAFLLGIPAGSVVGDLLGWRATFLFAALLSGIACVAITIWLPAVPYAAPAENHGIEWGRVLPPVIMTLLSFAATMAVVSYIGPVLELEAGIRGRAVGLFQVIIGLGALLGLVVGGRAANNGAGRRAVAGAFTLILVAQIIHFVELGGGAPKGLPTLMLVGWAIFSSAFALFAIMPIIQARLVSIAPSAAALVLAVNGSMNYFGQGLGAGLGGLAIRLAGFPSVALLGAVLSLIGLLLAAKYHRSQRQATGSSAASKPEYSHGLMGQTGWLE
ncbi:MFS transporter [Microvirga sp. 3-52]|nr:MFS transporter [Microvirga sp. 3-52]